MAAVLVLTSCLLRYRRGVGTKAVATVGSVASSKGKAVVFMTDV